MIGAVVCAPDYESFNYFHTKLRDAKRTSHQGYIMGLYHVT